MKIKKIAKKFVLLLLGAVVAVLVISIGFEFLGSSNSADNFGTEINRPSIKGPVDFVQRVWTVGGIYISGELDGGPVLRPFKDKDGWLNPYFREQICLVVSINNHCLG